MAWKCIQDSHATLNIESKHACGGPELFLTCTCQSPGSFGCSTGGAFHVQYQIYLLDVLGITCEEWYSSIPKSQDKHTSNGKIQWDDKTDTISISSSYSLQNFYVPSLPGVICGLRPAEASCSIQISFAGLAGSGRHDSPVVIWLPRLSSKRGSRRKKMLSGTMWFSTIENSHSFEAGTSQVRGSASALGTPEIH